MVYCIAAYFQGGKFFTNCAFPAFQGQNFQESLQIVYRVPTENKHFEGKFSQIELEIRENFPPRK